MATATVEGVVSKVFASRGFSIRESFNKRDGGTVTRYWNVFVPDGQMVTVVQDERVKATGLLQATVSERDNRYVDHKLSNATVERSGNAPVPPATEQPDTRNDTPPDDPWGPVDTWQVTSIPGDPTPF